MHVREDGDPTGAPVLLVHGFGASLHWFDRLVPLLSSCRVIRVDLLAHGCTGGAAADAPDQALAIAQVLRVLGVSDVIAVGHSFGADVVLALAEQADLVSRLVLIGQAADYAGANFPKGDVLMTLPVLGGVLQKVAPAAAVRKVGAYSVAPGFRLGPTLDAQLVADHHAMDVGMFKVILTRRRKRMKRHPLDVQVRELALPTLVILGGRDRFYGARSAARYIAAGAQVEVLPESGHSPIVEAPGAVARLIKGFLA